MAAATTRMHVTLSGFCITVLLDLPWNRSSPAHRRGTLMFSSPHPTLRHSNSSPDIAALFLDVFHQPLGGDLRTENVPCGIDRDALRGTRGRRLLDRIGNEPLHRAVGQASDPDAALPAVMILRHRFRFG